MPDTSTPVVTGVDFIGVNVTDLERARSFYRDVLGLHESVVRAPYNVEYDLGGTTLTIMDGSAMGADLAAPPNKTHLSLHVDDFEVACTTVAERGVTFTRDHVDTGVCHMAFLEDPDGNALMLHHRYAPKEN